MKTLNPKIKTLLLALGISGTIAAQCNYSHTYSSNAGWTMNGGSYTIGPNTFSFNATPDAVYNYAVNQLPCTLSNTSWCAEIDFVYTARTAFGVGHTLMSFTENTQNSWNTGFYNTSNNDMIEVYINCNPNSPEFIYARSKNGTTFDPPSTGISVSAGNTYYLRLQRLSATNGLVSVYSNPGRTILVGSSCFTISSGVQNLQYVQHGGIPQGSASRQLTGTLDNLVVNDVVSGITGIGSGFCAGTTSTVCVNPICGAISYNWTLPAGSTINSGQGTNCVNVTWGTTSGSVNCTASFQGAPCGHTQTSAVTIFPNPVANAGPDFNLCCGTIWYLGNNTGTATGGTPGYTFNWSPGTHLSCTNCQSPQLDVCSLWTIGQSITYTLTVTDANGCTATDMVNVTRINCRLANPDLQNTNASEVIRLMPNPASGKFTIQFISPETSHAIEITDMLGNIVFKKDEIGDATMEVDFSSQAKGVYLVKCEENGQVYFQRLVIE